MMVRGRGEKVGRTAQGQHRTTETSICISFSEAC